MINVGDEIYAIKNCMWGNKPMKVSMVDRQEGVVSATHPDLGSGLFDLKDVESFNELRRARLMRLADLKERYDILKKQLFGSD